MVESRPPCRGDEIGKHSGLKALSAQPETAGAEPFKFGETPESISRQRRAKPVFVSADSAFADRLKGRRGRCRD
jgi:hypothetical protein